MSIISQIIGKNCKRYKEKARCIKNGEAELIIEMFTNNKENLLQELNDLEQITQVNCLSHDGECRI